jgi:hypothetical protein
VIPFLYIGGEMEEPINNTIDLDDPCDYPPIKSLPSREYVLGRAQLLGRWLAKVKGTQANQHPATISLRTFLDYCTRRLYLPLRKVGVNCRTQSGRQKLYTVCAKLSRSKDYLPEEWGIVYILCSLFQDQIWRAGEELDPDAVPVLRGDVLDSLLLLQRRKRPGRRKGYNESNR